MLWPIQHSADRKKFPRVPLSLWEMPDRSNRDESRPSRRG